MRASACRHTFVRAGVGSELVIGRRWAPSACSTAAAAAPVIVSAVWLETVRAIGITIDSDNGENNHRRRLGICVDIFAAARTRVVGKSNDFAHYSPPSAPAWFPRASPVRSAIKGLARLTPC